MRRIEDPGYVREQYETEDRLRARKTAYTTAGGPNAREVLFEAIAEAEPRRVLEVGGGEGELAERLVRELDVELVGIDQSERMVEIQRGKGIDARVGEAQTLPFVDAEFDLVVAAWMLYHVRELDRALGEIARVLVPGGRLVAVTNSADHLRELTDLGGLRSLMDDSKFRSDNGSRLLRRHFARVERRDLYGWVTFDDAAMRAYAGSSERLSPLLDLPPLERVLRARREPTIFIAEKRS